MGHSSARPIRNDREAIIALLRMTADSWVPRHFPNGRQVGDEWRLANIKGEAPRKQGSCVIQLKGEHAGDWHDFDGGKGGNPISALKEITGRTGRDLLAYVAEVAGWSSPSSPTASPATNSSRNTERAIELILKHSIPLAGTPASTYLIGRGLSVPDTADLLFHPSLKHGETGTDHPAMIGVVRWCDGEVRGIHRTYLQVDETASSTVTKAAISKPRMMLGKVKGGAVRLAPAKDDGFLGLSEGIETGLAVTTSVANLPVWSTLSTSGLTQVQLPANTKRIIILADHDESGAGLRAAEVTAQRLRAEGREVVIALPPKVGDDFNDVIRRDGREVVAAIVESALNARENATKVGHTDATVGNLPIGFATPATTLPVLRADDGDLAHAGEQAWRVLLRSNQPPWLFRSAGLLTWIVADDDGRPVAAAITDEGLRFMLAKLANWRRLKRSDFVPAHPPMPVVKTVLATPDPRLPVLSGIVSTPVFGRHGTLLTTPGYHSEARLFYSPPPGFIVPLIPVRPTAEEIANARSVVLDELLGDFPFTSQAERAHATALLLLGFVRPMIDGPTPLHLIEKPAPGTGATLLANVVAIILAGTEASIMTEAGDDDEWRKRITAKLRQFPAVLFIDNIHRKLDSSALAAALTAPYWEDRVLGSSVITRLPVPCIWVATGNNPEFSNEMARRLIRIRLDARVDQPWRREGFRHPDLLLWVHANRARLVAACLTLCRAWLAAGRPPGTCTMGSYEAWAQTIGGVLKIAGIEGFLDNTDEMMQASDGEGAVWRNFVSAWWEKFGSTEVGTSDLFESATGCDPPLSLGSGNDRSQRIRLGKALRRIRERTFMLPKTAVRIEPTRICQGAQRWRLTES